MLRLHTQTRKIDTVFIVCLFMLFAMTSCILILIGAKQYHTTADAMNHNYEVRTVSSYLTEKVHQYDTSTGIAITDFAGGHALALSDTAEEQTYITYIYYYDGALRELFVGEEAVFTPESGQSIIPLDSFDVEPVHAGLIRATYTDTEGFSHTLYLGTHEKEGLS